MSRTTAGVRGAYIVWSCSESIFEVVSVRDFLEPNLACAFPSPYVLKSMRPMFPRAIQNIEIPSIEQRKVYGTIAGLMGDGWVGGRGFGYA